MDTFELNKIAGAILFSMLVIFGVRELSNILIHENRPEQVAFPVPAIETEAVATEETEEAEEAGPSLATLLASADPASGEKVAKKCAACHTFTEGGANRVGPNLYGILQDSKARSADFGYSPALSDMGGEWTYDDLNAFLAKPKEYLPGTKMAFPGLKKASDRADLIAYLRSLGDEDVPLPTPE